VVGRWSLADNEVDREVIMKGWLSMKGWLLFRFEDV
jgi:hypothetical protein